MGEHAPPSPALEQYAVARPRLKRAATWAGTAAALSKIVGGDRKGVAHIVVPTIAAGLAGAADATLEDKLRESRNPHLRKIVEHSFDEKKASLHDLFQEKQALSNAAINGALDKREARLSGSAGPVPAGLRERTARQVDNIGNMQMGAASRTAPRPMINMPATPARPPQIVSSGPHGFPVPRPPTPAAAPAAAGAAVAHGAPAPSFVRPAVGHGTAPAAGLVERAGKFMGTHGGAMLAGGAVLGGGVMLARHMANKQASATDDPALFAPAFVQQSDDDQRALLGSLFVSKDKTGELARKQLGDLLPDAKAGESYGRLLRLQPGAGALSHLFDGITPRAR